MQIVNEDLAKLAVELPDFREQPLLPKKHKYSIIIPIINEGARIHKQLNKMASLQLPVDIILVDGGSTDGSLLDLEKLRQYGVIALLTKTGPGKLSAQLRIGLAYSVEKGYEGSLVIDGNGKDGVEAIPKFCEKLDEGYDFVQGSRYVKGGEAINTPWDRHLGVKLIHAPLISVAARFWYTDTTNGFRAYSKRFLVSPAIQAFRACFSKYNLHYYLAIEAARQNFKVIEIPVRRAYPANGEVPSKISGFKGKMAIIKELGLCVIGHYRVK